MTITTEQQAVAQITRNEAGQIRICDGEGNAFDMSKHVGVRLYTRQQVIKQLAEQTGVMPSVVLIKASVLDGDVDVEFCIAEEVRKAFAKMQARVEHEKWLREGSEDFCNAVQDQREELRAQVEQLEKLVADACKYPDCLDNEDERCTRWLTGDCGGPGAISAAPPLQADARGPVPQGFMEELEARGRELKMCTGYNTFGDYMLQAHRELRRAMLSASPAAPTQESRSSTELLICGLEALSNHVRSVNAYKNLVGDMDLVDRAVRHISRAETAKPITGECWPESVMKQWDYWRKQIANGDTSSAPRDWFESLSPEPSHAPLEVVNVEKALELLDGVGCDGAESDRKIDSAIGMLRAEVEKLRQRTELPNKETPPVVARMLSYIGKDTYPAGLRDRGYLIARSYNEIKENAYPDTWKEGEKLITLKSHNEIVASLKFTLARMTTERDALELECKTAAEAYIALRDKPQEGQT